MTPLAVVVDVLKSDDHGSNGLGRTCLRRSGCSSQSGTQAASTVTAVDEYDTV